MCGTGWVQGGGGEVIGRDCQICGKSVESWDCICTIEINANGFNRDYRVCERCRELFIKVVEAWAGEPSNPQNKEKG